MKYVDNDDRSGMAQVTRAVVVSQADVRSKGLQCIGNFCRGQEELVQIRAVHHLVLASSADPMRRENLVPSSAPAHGKSGLSSGGG